MVSPLRRICITCAGAGRSRRPSSCAGAPNSAVIAATICSAFAPDFFSAAARCAIAVKRLSPFQGVISSCGFNVLVILTYR